ncbi:hypothetical protein [Streptomyces viridochromogenes]|uniref:hypothetical protein n=1 Tax=Streptomyces TaxID=1883 RepID=UPI003AEFE327
MCHRAGTAKKLQVSQHGPCHKRRDPTACVGSRAEERVESEAWSQQWRMPPLEGTERAAPWGARCRHQILAAAYTALVVEGDTSETEWEEIEESARTSTRAGWWIDQRSSEPDDLPELLQAATDADRPNENPYF